MNAIYLHKPDGTPTKWSQCGECGQVASPGNYDLSEKCCTCYDCGKPLPPDQRVRYASGSGYSLYHRECEQARRSKRKAEQLEKAQLVEGYEGPVYYEGLRGSYGDGYFHDVNELVEILDDQEDRTDWPEFAFCCTSMCVSIDIGSILERCTEEMDEDAGDRLNGTEELERAVDAFNKTNENVVSWYEDREHKVAVPQSANAVKPQPVETPEESANS